MPDRDRDERRPSGASEIVQMKLTKAKSFTATTPWGKERLALFGEIGVNVHWTDQPYRWHRNTGREVFVVMDGLVDMHYREDGEERVLRLEEGDALTIEEGEEHVAHPVGEARILVVERSDSE